MIIKYLVLGLAFLCSFVLADPLEDFAVSFDEQQSAVEWVKESTRGSVSADQATAIVREAYANAYSRHINPLLVLAVIRNESNFKANASSKDGSRGLMQVIPKWHKDKLAGRNPLNVATSVDVGTWILKDCLVKHKGIVHKALSCYSGGGGSVYFNKVMKFHYALAQSVKVKSVLVASR